MKHTVGHYSDKPSPWVIAIILAIAFMLMLSDESWEQIGSWIIMRIIGIQAFIESL